jgi:hypothetical protein
MAPGGNAFRAASKTFLRAPIGSVAMFEGPPEAVHNTRPAASQVAALQLVPPPSIPR